MLPTHRSPPSIEHLSKLSPKSWFNKPRLRWLTLTGILVLALWVVIPLIRDFWKPLDFGLGYSIPPPSHIVLPPMPKPPTLEEQRIWDGRKDEVRESFKHAWTGYKSRAFPSDELLPISGGRSDK